MKNVTYLLSSLSIFAVSASLQAQVVYQDNFDSYSLGPINGQGGWVTSSITGSSAADVSNAEALSGSQSLYMLDDSASDRPIARIDYGQNVTESVFDIAILPTGNDFWRIDMTSTASGVFNFSLLGNGGGTIRLTDQFGGVITSIATSSTSYSETDWNEFSIIANETDGTARVTLGGVEILNVTDASINWTIGASEFSLGYNGGTDIEVYYDNLSLAQIPEPGYYATLFGALSVLVLTLRSRQQQK
ncbi:hypothetical protein [Cerasicoccus frondis]|uniref:hypothetical protein n=1 Tax=Cerasicoccus frondis TaxID=490090 RepID=UPI00285263A3|nr:hypothetical protein [Cerasicoccus frondis]